MIFVTVGTHEQPFDRLIKEIDRLKEQGLLSEEVVIQTGYSNYVPKNCIFNQFYAYDEMQELMEKATIVITHGGPASFMKVISLNKIPIVVPRLLEYDEHVNNHQLDFVNKVIEKNYPIVVVEEIHHLSDALKMKITINENLQTNNQKFNNELSKIVNNLNGGKK